MLLCRTIALMSTRLLHRSGQKKTKPASSPVKKPTPIPIIFLTIAAIEYEPKSFGGFKLAVSYVNLRKQADQARTITVSQ
jgi:hypothetical protein